MKREREGQGDWDLFGQRVYAELPEVQKLVGNFIVGLHAAHLVARFEGKIIGLFRPESEVKIVDEEYFEQVYGKSERKLDDSISSFIKSRLEPELPIEVQAKWARWVCASMSMQLLNPLFKRSYGQDVYQAAILASRRAFLLGANLTRDLTGNTINRDWLNGLVLDIMDPTKRWTVETDQKVKMFVNNPPLIQ